MERQSGRSVGSCEKRFDIEKTGCPVCHLNGGKRLFIGRDRLCKREGQFGIVHCESCGLIYTNPRPTQETIGYFYPKNYGPYHEVLPVQARIFLENEGRSARLKNEIKYEILRRYYGYRDLKPVCISTHLDKLSAPIKRLVLRICYFYFRDRYHRIPGWEKGGRALDLGCGNGTYLLLLKKMGWDAVGVDINDKVGREIKEAKIPVLTGELRKLKIRKGSFNLITMWHVLEHLHSPFETLQEVHRLLTDNGCLLIEVPNSTSLVRKLFRSNWFAWEVPRHLCHFSPRTLAALLNRSGFEIQEMKHLQKTTLRESIIYLLEELGINIKSDQLCKNKFYLYLEKVFSVLLSLLHTSEIIFVKARKV